MTSVRATIQTASMRSFVPVGSVDLYVHAFGDGKHRSGLTSVTEMRESLAATPDLPVLLVLHGGPGGDHRALVPPLRPLVSGNCFLLFTDLRGHGLSGRPGPTECTLAHMADDLAALRDTLAIEPPRLNVLGVSFGARVALAFAERHAGECARLLLSSAVANFVEADADWVEWAQAHGTPEQARAARAIVEGALPSLAALREAQRLVRPLYYADPAHLPTQDLAACAGEAVPDEDVDLVNWWYRQGKRVEHAAARVKVPTLILAGCADPLATPAQASALAAATPGAQLRLFERSGHLPHFEEPEAYRAAIADFMGLSL